MVNLIPQALSLVGIGLFLYFSFVGVFQGGGSNSVFIGVAALSAVLVACKFLEKWLQD